MDKKQLKKLKISTTEALNFAKEQIFDNKDQSNLFFVTNFVEVFLNGLKASGQDKTQTPADFMLQGVTIGYALRYMTEEGGSDE